MISSRIFPRLVFMCASALGFVPGIAFAAPAPAIAPLIGEWTGESTRTAAGEPAAQQFDDVRRYWVEGDAVRGEILFGAGNSLQSVRVAIVPRLGYFLKILTAENGRVDQLVGVPAEQGVLWTPLSGDRNRFIERVTGDGGQRRLELLLPEGDSASLTWRVAGSLQPAGAALTGVVGGGSSAAAAAAPLTLPRESELALIDRVAELLLQRDAARGDTSNLARELAAAWRESESAGARAKALDNEVAELKSQLAGSTAPVESEEMLARVAAAEKDAVEARRWADELEKSLRSTTAKAEDDAARAERLAQELAAARTEAQRLADERTRISVQLEAQAAEAARVTELEATVRDLRTKAAAAEAAAAETARVNETLTRVGALETDLQSVRADLAAARNAQQVAAQEAARAGTARSTAEARVAELTAQLATATNDRVAAQEKLTATEVLLAAAEAAQRQAEERLAANTGTAEAAQEIRAQLDSAKASLATREKELAAARAANTESQTQLAALESRLTAVTAAQSDAQTKLTAAQTAAARVTELESMLAELNGQLARRESALAESTQARTTAESAVVQLRSELATARNGAGAAAASASQVAALETELSQARQQLASRDEKIATLESSAQELNASREAARGQLSTLTTERDAAQARVAELESELVQARESTAMAVAATADQGKTEADLATVRQELATAREELATAAAQRTKLEQALRTATEAQQRAETQLAATTTDRDAARRAIATLEGQIEKLVADAPPAGEVGDESERVAALERDLAAVRGQLATMTTQSGALENRVRIGTETQTRLEKELAEARRSIADEHARAMTLETELADARKAAAPNVAETARLTSLETELKTAQAEIALARERRAGLERALAAAQEANETAARLVQTSDTDLDTARARIAELEGEISAERSRVAQLERERPDPTPQDPGVPRDQRIRELEDRLAATFSRAQQRQDEIDRLNARLNELESSSTRVATVPVPTPAFSLTPPAAPTEDEEALRRQLAEAEIARQRTAQRNRELEERLRAANSRDAVTAPPTNVPARPVARAEIADEAVSFRLSPPRASAPAAPSSGLRLPPTRPTENRVFVIPSGGDGPDDLVAGAVRALRVNGYRRSGGNSIVIVSGRPYRMGDIVDTRNGLRFVRIDPDAIVFSGPLGAEYRYQL